MKEPLTQTNCWFGASATDQTSKTTKKNHRSCNFNGSHKNHSKGKSKGF
jgi:hypothetical protein